MVDKLTMDLAKCAQLSGHGDILSHREIVPFNTNDRDGNRRMIVIDKAIDMAPEGVATSINKVYDSFYVKADADFWDHLINMFEYKHDVDWYLMLSYLYMVNEDRDNSSRALATATGACKVLIQLDAEEIEKEAGFTEYMNLVNKMSKSKVDPIKEAIKIDLS